jgi:hypothetical protein
MGVQEAMHWPLSHFWPAPQATVWISVQPSLLMSEHKTLLLPLQ